MHSFILHNGELIPNDAHTASVGQVGLLNGWGVFSTIRVIHGVMFAWERHWERMSRDAALMRVPMPASAEELKGQLKRLIEANGAVEATLRVAVVRNKGGVFQSPHLERDYDVIAYTVNLQDWGTSARLDVQEQGRHAESPLSGLKLTSWSNNLTFLERAKSRGYDEVVLLNERGEVSECTSANLFIVRGSSVLTPPLSSGCLPGITRLYLLDEVRVEGIAVEEATVLLEDLYTADEVFMTSTTRELLRVASAGGRDTGTNDAVRARLHDAFRASMEQYVAAGVGKLSV